MKPEIYDSLNKTLPTLTYISRMSENNRKKFLSDLVGEPDFIAALHEIAYNTLKGRLKLPPSRQSELKPYTRTLKNLCNSKNRNCAKKRKHLFEQSGGFLPILIPALTALLSTIVSKNK